MRFTIRLNTVYTYIKYTCSTQTHITAYKHTAHTTYLHIIQSSAGDAASPHVTMAAAGSHGPGAGARTPPAPHTDAGRHIFNGVPRSRTPTRRVPFKHHSSVPIDIPSRSVGFKFSKFNFFLTDLNLDQYFVIFDRFYISNFMVHITVLI